MVVELKKGDTKTSFMTRAYLPENNEYAVVGGEFLEMFAATAFAEDAQSMREVVEAARLVLGWAKEDCRWVHQLDPDLWALGPECLNHFLDEVEAVLEEIQPEDAKERAMPESW